MANTQSNKPLTFALSYGFVEGSAHGRKITKLLKQVGMKPAKSLHDADVIIAHSAGCWLMPDRARPKLILYIGMPLPLTRPQKIWLNSNWLSISRLLAKGHFLRIIQGFALNTYYALRHPLRSLNIVRGAKTSEPTIFPDAVSIFIANRFDPWPKSAKLDDYIKHENWAFLSLPGGHDNIWQHPAYYVDIINNYARLLAKTDHR